VIFHGQHGITTLRLIVYVVFPFYMPNEQAKLRASSEEQAICQLQPLVRLGEPIVARRCGFPTPNCSYAVIGFHAPIALIGLMPLSLLSAFMPWLDAFLTHQ
jgi:hypothetical protein